MELGNTLAIMANEVSMMWEHLFDVEGSRVCIRRVNALVIDKLTAVKFRLEADAAKIKVTRRTIRSTAHNRFVRMGSTWCLRHASSLQLYIGQ